MGKENSGGQVSIPNKSVLIKAKARLGITRLFKNYLFGLEELIVMHDEAMKKLHDELPEQYKGYVKLADYLSDARVEILRRKVLGAGNDAIRDMDETIDSLRID